MGAGVKVAVGMVLTTLVALAAVLFSRRFATGANEVTLGLMQLFCAGVITAVALAHMLADSALMLDDAGMPEPTVGVLVGSAFLLMFIVESSTHIELRSTHSETGGERSEHGENGREHTEHEERRPLVHGHRDEAGRIYTHTPTHYCSTAEGNHRAAEAPQTIRSRGRHLSHGPTSAGFLDDEKEDNVKLLFALSLHAFFEGLGLAGLALKKGFYPLLFAICFHKALAGATIGVNSLHGEQQKLAKGVMFFAFATPIGTLVGFLLTSLDQVFDGFHTVRTMISGFFVALAGGTLLYVAALEILPHGLTCCASHQAIGLSLLFLGFASMSALAFIV